MAGDAPAAGGPSDHKVSGTGRVRSPGVVPPRTAPPPTTVSFQSSGVIGRHLGAGRRPPVSPGVSGIGEVGELGDGVFGQQQGHAPPQLYHC